MAIRAKEVRANLYRARNQGARVCAQRELTLSETHLEIAEREMERGERKIAKKHLEIAESRANEALRLSSSCERRAAPPPTSTLDSDGDGIPDVRDRCPKVAEDMDLFQDDDGCPDTDNDEDGIPDAYDRCPDEAEDYDGFEDEDGCPESDNDRDGVLDQDDKCPLQPGPMDPDARGCPKFKTYSHISLTKEKIEIHHPIAFAVGKAVIGRRSYALLDEVADVLKMNPQMRVRVEGHTDSRGDPVENKRLSRARAEAVKAYLVGRGIEERRLVAAGLGSEQPIETNKTRAGREKNQRIEFVVLQQ